MNNDEMSEMAGMPVRRGDDLQRDISNTLDNIDMTLIEINHSLKTTNEHLSGIRYSAWFIAICTVIAAIVYIKH